MISSITSASSGLSADAVVVGLGAGGGMALRTLAESGIDVIGLELGEDLPIEHRTAREDQMIPRLFAEGGARSTDDMGISIIQGKGIGGSTLHNTNLIGRINDETTQAWTSLGLGETLRELDQSYALAERLLHVSTVDDDQVNRNNQIFWDGAHALGWEVHRMKHNRVACKGSGMCTLGCPNNAKRTTANVLVPDALAAGARVFENARASKIIVQRGRVCGVDVAGYGVIKTGRVFLAGSAMGSPALAIASGLGDGQTGSNLHLHPGTTVAGRFEEPVEGWLGIPQSVSSDQFLDQGAWLVPGFAHPGAASMFVPGFGSSHHETMTNYAHLAAVIIMLHDTSTGRVRPGTDDVVHSTYALNRRDRRALELGIRRAASLLLAAGAVEVFLPSFPPVTVRSEREVEAAKISIGLMSPALTSVHPMSTMPMGISRRKSVTNPWGAHWNVRGLHVADTSLFPTSIGGPPQLTAYALGDLVARAALNET